MGPVARAVRAVIVPVDNGALIGGIGRWMRAHAPGSRVIGACAEGAPAMAQSWRSGRKCTTVAADTAPDTIAVRIPVREALQEIRTAVDDMVLVGEDRLRDAVRRLHRELGLVVDPAGAALAAAIEVSSDRRDRLVAIVISGGESSPCPDPDLAVLTRPARSPAGCGRACTQPCE
jgi:threonine dehydratase